MKTKTCAKTNKTCFPTEQMAKSELAFCKMAFLNGNDSYQQIRYYKCGFCGDFHLTSQELKEEKNECIGD